MLVHLLLTPVAGLKGCTGYAVLVWARGSISIRRDFLRDVCTLQQTADTVMCRALRLPRTHALVSVHLYNWCDILLL